MLLTDDTDWEEIRELVIESYRILAPKKLTALLDEGRCAPRRAGGGPPGEAGLGVAGGLGDEV